MTPKHMCRAVVRFINATDAASYVSQHLGESSEYWRNFLRDDRHPRVSEEDRVLPFEEHEGEYWYELRDLYRFVLLRNPGALGVATRDDGATALASTFTLDAEPAIDFTNRCNLVVELSIPEHFVGLPWITAKESRELAGVLLSAANWCDSHVYDPYTRECRPRTAEAAETKVGSEACHE